LPWKTYSCDYELEYGKNTLELHTDAACAGDRVLLIDDLLATGGSADAAIQLLRKTGAEIMAALFVVELDFLNGRKKLHGTPISSLVHVS